MDYEDYLRSSNRPKNQTPMKYTVKSKDTWEKIAAKFMNVPDPNPEEIKRFATQLARSNRNVRGPVAGTIIRVPKTRNKTYAQTEPQTVTTYTGTAQWPDRPWAQPAPRYATGTPHTLPTLGGPRYATGTPHTLPTLPTQTTDLNESAAAFAAMINQGKQQEPNYSSMTPISPAASGQLNAAATRFGKNIPGYQAPPEPRPRFRGPGFRERGRASDFSEELVEHNFSVAALAFAEGRKPLVIHDWDLDYMQRNGYDISEDMLLGMGYYKLPLTGNYVLLSGYSSGLSEPTGEGYSSGWSGLGSSISYGGGGRGGGGGGGYNYPTYTGVGENYAQRPGYEMDSGRILRSTSLGTLSWRI